MSYTRKLLEAIVSDDRLSTKEIFEAVVREKIMEEIEIIRPHISESLFDEEVDVSKVMSDYKAGNLGSFKAQGGRKGLIKRKIAANLAKRAASVKEDYVAEDDFELWSDDDDKPKKQKKVKSNKGNVIGGGSDGKIWDTGRKQRRVKEEVEQVDELSTKTLSKYVAKRGAQLRGGSGDAKKIDGINMALFKIKKNSAKK